MDENPWAPLWLLFAAIWLNFTAVHGAGHYHGRRLHDAERRPLRSIIDTAGACRVVVQTLRLYTRVSPTYWRADSETRGRGRAR